MSSLKNSLNGPASFEAHVDDPLLLALFDDVAREDEARGARAHIAGCSQCATALARLESLRARAAHFPGKDGAEGRGARARTRGLPKPLDDGDSAFAGRVLSSLDSRQRRAPRVRLGLALAWLGTPALAAAALLLVLSSTETDELVARGGAPRTLLGLSRLDSGQRSGALVAVDDAAVIHRGAPLALSASVLGVSVTDIGSAFVVVAHDASGAITWLWPSWVDASTAPPCPRLGEVRAASRFVAAGPLVAFLQPPPVGRLTVELWVIPGACEVSVLDDILESTGQLPPSMGARRDVRSLNVR